MEFETQKLTFSEHAELRMRERDVTEVEVREVLTRPIEEHWFNPVHETMNVSHSFPNLKRAITVGYDKERLPVHVVTVIVEDED